MVAFFAAAIIDNGPLEGHLPQVLLELIAWAKRLGYVTFLFILSTPLTSSVSKSHIRGALTTGHKWHFVVVDLDTDGDGAKYWVSELIEWLKAANPFRRGLSRELSVESQSDESEPALIAGILSTWVSLNDLVFSSI
jgi:hypothetical protein